MPKSSRLSREELDILFAKRPLRLPGTYFDLSVSEGGAAKAACVVSKKVAPKATARNKIRRRAYAALTRLKAPTHLWLVFTAKKGSDTAPFSAVAADVEALVRAAAVSYNRSI